MQGRKNERFMKLLSVFAVIVVTAVVGHIVSIVSYNNREHVTQGASPARESYLLLDKRKDTTSAWLKRDFDYEGRKVDLSGQIFDGALKNRAADDISNWRLTLRFHGNCYLNNAWCGLVEIHQGVASGAEKVQTLDLRHCDRSEIQLDYLEDNDLLIPLKDGDYLVYYPSAADREVPVQAGGSLEMGLIFYYLGGLDLSDYSLAYNYHKSYTEGAGFYLILFLSVLWCAAFFGLMISSYAYRKAMKEMEHRKVGISYMAVIYDFICIVDLANDDIVQIHGKGLGRQSSGRRFKATDRLKQFFIEDVAEEYQDKVRDFLDTTHLSKRLAGGSIACEYRSRAGLWYVIRLFAMEQEPGQPLDRFIFALRNIDADWHKMIDMQESRRQEQAGALPEAAFEAYSVRELVEKAAADIRGASESPAFELETDMSRDLPPLLLGYPHRLRLAIFCLALSNLLSETGEKMKLSVYGKAQEGSCHLLFSLKSGTAEKHGELSALCRRVAGDILAMLQVELSVLEDGDGESEFYFELDQEICDK